MKLRIRNLKFRIRNVKFRIQNSSASQRAKADPKLQAGGRPLDLGGFAPQLRDCSAGPFV